MAVTERPGVPASEPSTGHPTELVVTGLHGNALLGRLAVLLNPHEISHFNYAVQRDGVTARARVGIHGSSWQVERVSRKLRRVIGVTDVALSE